MADTPDVTQAASLHSVLTRFCASITVPAPPLYVGSLVLLTEDRAQRLASPHGCSVAWFRTGPHASVIVA